MDQSELIKIFAGSQAEIFGGLYEFLRFKSVSVGGGYDQECHDCATWLSQQISELGIPSRLIETSTHPLVFGERAAEPGQPTVLFYGHYDVQPAEPLELWYSDPFEPTIRDGRVYARGAVDDKGQVWAVLQALKTLIAQGKLQCGVKVLIEGEEEVGSGGLMSILPELGNQLKADLLLVCDSEMAGAGLPAVLMGLRGVIALDVRLGELSQELHSGLHGGVVKNPAIELCRMLSTLHKPDGSIAVAGYYDEVDPISEKMRELINKAPFDVEEYERAIGAPPTGGEPDFSPLERVGLRPAIDINGIKAGYIGPGIKNVIPAWAEVKLSSRLVPGQDPRRCLDLLKGWLKQAAPPEFEVTFLMEEFSTPAISISTEMPVLAPATKVLRELFGVDPVFAWCGGSIPVISSCMQYTKKQVLAIGFGLPEDGEHAPNESFEIERFQKGYLFTALLLQELQGNA